MADQQSQTGLPEKMDTSEQPQSSESSQELPRKTAEEVQQIKREPAQSRIPQATAQNAASTSSNAGSQRTLPGVRQQTQSLDGIVEGTKERAPKSTPNTPSWPTSPRLKSPPPNSTRTPIPKKESSESTPSNTARRLTNTSAPELAAAMLLPEASKELNQPPPTDSLRVPARNSKNQSTSGLETVQESSVPSTPSMEPKIHPSDMSKSEHSTSDRTDMSSSTKDVETRKQAKTDADSKARASSTSRPPTTLAKRSFTSLTGGKKQSEPMRTMTVETEPVTSNPQLMGDRGRDASSVRTKASTETIRPKKEKKKTTRKAPSLHAGSATSRADIFEAKVASAVDEVDDSDSDETFVYESNPPEPRSARHHSRTPSATSLASTADQYGRSKHGARAGSSAISGKKSMKFSNSGWRDPDDQDSGRNTSRGVSSTPRHHHIGRHGRNGHPSLFDQDSAFGSKPNSPRVATGNSGRPNQGSRPNSPRTANSNRLAMSPRKYGGNAYDNYEDVADDERAPLIGTVRINRNRHTRRPNSREYRLMDLKESEQSRSWSRFMLCIMTIILAFLVCVAGSTFIVLLNRPLLDVQIKRIQNVLASEQELMLDLDVQAVNPNIFTIMVNDLNVELFAASPYAGPNRDWDIKKQATRLSMTERRMSSTRVTRRGWFWPDPEPEPKPGNGVDEGTDPDDDLGSQKLLLGSILVFDSPLVFDAAPIRRNTVSSVGEIRLSKPGNRTDPAGSQRWERIVSHEFDIIVRGVIKYSLPLSSKIHSAKISGRRTVHPNDETTLAVFNPSQQSHATL